jgi:hypothetical protein
MTLNDAKGVIEKAVNNILSDGAAATIALLSAIAIWYIMHEQQKVESAIFKETIEELRVEKKEIINRLIECQREHFRN